MENETANLDSSLKLVQEQLGSTYKFIQNLGGGVFSNVYLVRHLKTGQEYALKVLDYQFLLQKLRKENRQDPHLKITEIKKRFIAEAKLYKKIHHPNIVTIHDTGVIEDESRGIEIPYMVMTYIKGSSLSDLLKTQAPFSPAHALEISRDVLDALDAIHQNNIIHRDIKPANIMVENETGKAVIIDFGIAKDIVGGSRLTTTGSSIGTPPYMAPEQFVDSSKVDHTIDIYSFGIVLYEMLTGQPPFGGINFAEIMNAHREKPIPDPRSINPHLPQGITPIINKAMAKSPKDRFQSTRDLMNALVPLFQSFPIRTPYRDRGKIRRLKRLALYFLAVFIAAAASLVLITHLSRNETKPVKPGSTETVATPPGTKGASRPESQLTPQEQTREMLEDFKRLKETLANESSEEFQIEKYRAFLEKYKALATAGSEEAKAVFSEIDDILSRLNTGLAADSQYTIYIETAKKFALSRQYDKALELLNKATALNLTDKNPDDIKTLKAGFEKARSEEEKINGKPGYDSIKDTIDLAKYKEFKNTVPGSLYLPDLRERLLKKEINLPPEKYWDSISKNRKGYYEITFDRTVNNHCMIFIPERKLWIDKYEVSNKQYREYLAAINRPVPAGPSDGYINTGDEYPAVVSYEDAENYCRKYGFRLPRLDEWEYAAGKGTNIYPWGNAPPGAGGTYQANFDSLEDEGNEEKDGFRGTAPVKRFADFPSACGALNMAGNVWEWVQGRILKGGSFISLPEQLLIKNSASGRENETQGFRCVKDE